MHHEIRQRFKVNSIKNTSRTAIHQKMFGVQRRNKAELRIENKPQIRDLQSLVCTVCKTGSTSAGRLLCGRRREYTMNLLPRAQIVTTKAE